ncbi:MAG: hypothetical protein ABI723_24925 [Bacteroidia bacterium]
MYNNKKTQSILETLEVKDRSHYMDKIKKYRNECGCSMGGVFTIISALFYVWYMHSALHDFSLFMMAKIIFFGIISILTAGLFGKIIGIAVARIKLLLLLHSLKSNVHNKNI